MSVIFFVANTLASLWFIRFQSAMQKVMITPIQTILVWLFYLFYKGDGHEDFHVISLVGMVLLTVGTFYFVQFEMSDLNMEIKEAKECGIQLSNEANLD